jgi:hypothetical protein
MDADADGHAPRPKISADVATCLIRVHDLDRSMKFYCDRFSCRVTLRQGDVAFLLAPSGFELYLNAHEWIRRRRRPGCPLLMWATESEGTVKDSPDLLHVLPTNTACLDQRAPEAAYRYSHVR